MYMNDLEIETILRDYGKGMLSSEEIEELIFFTKEYIALSLFLFCFGIVEQI